MAAAVIALAAEIRAESVVLDDKKARRIAAAFSGPGAQARSLQHRLTKVRRIRTCPPGRTAPVGRSGEARNGRQPCSHDTSGFQGANSPFGLFRHR